MLLLILNLENKLVLRNMHYLVYLRDLLKAYPKISYLEVIKAVLNANNLELMIKTLKESRKNLYLDISIKSLMVKNY